LQHLSYEGFSSKDHSPIDLLKGGFGLSGEGRFYKLTIALWSILSLSGNHSPYKVPKDNSVVLREEIGMEAAIRITLWSFYKSSPDWIQVDVTGELEKVVIGIHKDRFISPLKQVTGPASF
jgi:hypothetical protein